MKNSRPAETVPIVEEVQATLVLHYVRVALHRAIMGAPWRSGVVRCALPVIDPAYRKSTCDAIAAAPIAEVAIVTVAEPHFQRAIRLRAHRWTSLRFARVTLRQNR